MARDGGFPFAVPRRDNVSGGPRSHLSKPGVVAFSSTGDPEMGDYDDGPPSSSAMAGFLRSSIEIHALSIRAGKRVKQKTHGGA
jgi:hypothetical protein